jgi:hypothetical protein
MLQMPLPTPGVVVAVAVAVDGVALGSHRLGYRQSLERRRAQRRHLRISLLEKAEKMPSTAGTNPRALASRR